MAGPMILRVLPGRFTVFVSTRTSSLKSCYRAGYYPLIYERRKYSVHQDPVSFATEEETLHFIYGLKTGERERLAKLLNKFVESPLRDTASVKDCVSAEITAEQTRALFLFNALPFIGFGVLDNLLMILAGEYIDATLGVMFGISTMAAAGLGNIISDIAGVGSAHYVEYVVAKLGLKVPALTPDQWDSGKARWTSNAGRAAGLTVGCIIGMFPLLFFDDSSTQERKIKIKRSDVEVP